ncbi:MAG: cob(I)yrinic acid a,c-diamide adenosyltransferase [Deltaproteobacteria bacterium]|nr:cob(I)yrinic acid a,c-diamide adenosyltransferase [Deltaproteobacteria bacterium]
MKLYTRTGDDGGTALFGGERVKKHHARVRAYGAVDEANAAVGLVHTAADLPVPLKAALIAIMSDLFDVGAELATPAAAGEKLERHLQSRVDDARIKALEDAIDDATARCPPLVTFVLPTGGEAAARLHLARTIVRRAEREVVSLADSLADEAPLRPALVVYLNRLSDLLFAWARFAAHANGHGDIPWQGKKSP